jgi:DNA-binding transcriptional ArsR family regulator
MSEKFILVSLEDEKAKEIANIVSNDTCRKILDYLGDKDTSETDLSKALSMPLSTVHYNMQNLLKHGLVEIKDFVWSDKGNKINVYKIAKKFIVIAPKGENISSSLKNLVTVALISLGTSALIYIVTGSSRQGAAADTFGAAEIMMKEAGQASLTASAPIAGTNFTALWFLLGALFSIAIYMVLTYSRRKK